jgi:hypothetical protein
MKNKSGLILIFFISYLLSIVSVVPFVQASPTVLSLPATISIPGTYVVNEDYTGNSTALIIDTSSVIIEGNGHLINVTSSSSAVILNGTDGKYCTGCIINNLTIVSAGDAVEAITATGDYLNNCNISASGIGVNMTASSAIIFNNDTITSSGPEIINIGIARAAITNCNLTTSTPGTIGLMVFSGGIVSLVNCYVNTTSYALRGYDGASFAVTNSTCYSVNSWCAYGSGGAALIGYNDVFSSGDGAVIVGVSSQIELRTCNITAPVSGGLQLGSCMGLFVDCQVYAHNTGFLLTAESNITMYQTSVTSTASQAVSATSSWLYPTNCTFEAYTDIAVYSEASGLYLTNSNLINSATGLYTTKSSNTITGCKIEKNTDGITAENGLFSVTDNWFNNTQNFQYLNIGALTGSFSHAPSGVRTYGLGEAGGNYWFLSTQQGWSETQADIGNTGFISTPYDILGDGTLMDNYPLSLNGTAIVSPTPTPAPTTGTNGNNGVIIIATPTPTPAVILQAEAETAFFSPLEIALIAVVVIVVVVSLVKRK